MVDSVVETKRGTLLCNNQEYFPVSMLAVMKIPGLPKTRAGIYKIASREQWPVIHWQGRGAKGGVRYYLVPQEVLGKINALTHTTATQIYPVDRNKPLATGDERQGGLELNDHLPRTGLEPEYLVLVPQSDVKVGVGYASSIHSEQITDHLAFKKTWIWSTLDCDEKDLVLITVKGDSMEPTLYSEDLVLVNLRRNQITDNAVYVLQYDDSLLVKRIQRLMNGSIIIKSDNPGYKIEELSAEQALSLNVLGVVVWYGRKM